MKRGRLLLRAASPPPFSRPTSSFSAWERMSCRASLRSIRYIWDINPFTSKKFSIKETHTVASGKREGNRKRERERHARIYVSVALSPSSFRHRLFPQYRKDDEGKGILQKTVVLSLRSLSLPIFVHAQVRLIWAPDEAREITMLQRNQRERRRRGRWEAQGEGRHLFLPPPPHIYNSLPSFLSFPSFYSPTLPKFPLGVLSSSMLKISQLPSAAEEQILSRVSEPFL